MSKIVKNYDCGLRLIVEEMPGFKSVATSIMVTVGSSDELPGEHGLSHFCEHMLFKGTQKRTSEEITRELSTLGVDYNAWTSENATCYHTKGIRENVESCTDILADMYFNAKFADDDFNKEGNVIVQEIAMREDRPHLVVADLGNSTFFAGTKYEHSVTGTSKEVKSYKPTDIYNYIKKHYLPEKTIVAFAGDITVAEAERLVKKYFLPYYKTKNKPLVLEKTDKTVTPVPQIVKKKKNTEQQSVTLLFPVCNMYNDDKYALYVLGAVFSGDMSSRLFVNVRERAGLVYTIMGGAELTDIGGYYYIFFSCTPKNTNLVIETTKAEIKKLLEGGITADELQKVKNIKRTDRLFESENTERINARNQDELANHNEIKTTEEYLKILDSITVEDVNAVAKKYLDVNKMLIATVGK
ncbi:MAG: insulinase family protein [Christensenellaceae bacterium]|jgi:predicted Zn-dependent peptidase|nr:insulinase family protein [Christensenellaceae bacterium]